MSRAAARPLPALRGGLSHAGERAPEAEAKRLKQRQSPGCCEPSPRPAPSPLPAPRPAQPLTLLSPSAIPFPQLEPPPAPQPHWPPPRGAAKGLPLRPSGPRRGARAPGLPPHPGVWEGSGQRHSQHSSGFSSELSPQSSSPSHFQARGLHRVLLHWNSSKGHVRTATAQEGTCQLVLPCRQNPTPGLQFQFPACTGGLQGCRVSRARMHARACSRAGQRGVDTHTGERSTRSRNTSDTRAGRGGHR